MPDWIQNLDDQVLRWFLDNHCKFLDQNLRAVTELGSRTVLALFAAFILGVLLVALQFRRAVLVALVLAGAYYATDTLKTEVARKRPNIANAAGKGRVGSFPSSHASLTMAVFLVGAASLRVRPAGPRGRGCGAFVVLWALVLSLLVGVSRLYFGFHFLSDVVAGWGIGLGCAVVYCLADWLTAGRAEEPAPA